MDIQRILITVLLPCFCLTYLITYPNFFFSVDELSYCTKSLAFGAGQLDWTQIAEDGTTFSWAPADYPLGTAFLLSFFAFFSKNAIFISGLLYTSLSAYLIGLTLKKLNSQHYLAFVLFFIFPPTIYFSRGLMSEMPSLLLLAFYTFIFISRKDQNIKYFTLGLLAGLSIFFRETNIILCGGLVVFSLLKNWKYIIPFFFGTIIGVLPRLLSAKFLYGEVYYVKKYASFGLSYFPHNLPLYLIITLVLIPGGLFVLYKYRGAFAKHIQLSLFLFLITHLFYGYHSGDHSGFLVSLFYNGRYFVPTLPLWCIVFAEFGSQKAPFQNKNIRSLLITLTLAFIICSNFSFNYLEKKHKAVADDIFEKYNNELIIYDNSAYRYLNPLHGNIKEIASFDQLKKGTVTLSKKAYLVLSHRNKTQLQDQQWKYHLKKLSSLEVTVKEVAVYNIFDGTSISVFELTPHG